MSKRLGRKSGQKQPTNHSVECWGHRVKWYDPDWLGSCHAWVGEAPKRFPKLYEVMWHCRHPVGFMLGLRSGWPGFPSKSRHISSHGFESGSQRLPRLYRSGVQSSQISLTLFFSLCHDHNRKMPQDVTRRQFLSGDMSRLSSADLFKRVPHMDSMIDYRKINHKRNAIILDIILLLFYSIAFFVSWLRSVLRVCMVTSNDLVLSETFPRPEHHGIVAKRTCCASFQQPSGDTVLPSLCTPPSQRRLHTWWTWHRGDHQDQEQYLTEIDWICIESFKIPWAKVSTKMPYNDLTPQVLVEDMWTRQGGYCIIPSIGETQSHCLTCIPSSSQ